MSGSGVDVSELRAFEKVLDQAPRKVRRTIRASVSRGALAIKRQLQAEAKGSRSFGGMARSISYDMHEFGGFGAEVFEAEIGPTKGGAGSLANIAYFGGSRGGGASVPDPQGALDAEAPKFERAISDLVGDL